MGYQCVLIGRVGRIGLFYGLNDRSRTCFNTKSISGRIDIERDVA